MIIDRNKIIAAHPLDAYVEKLGFSCKRRTESEVRCCCPLHDEKTPSFDINLDKKVWICRAGCGSGSVIDLHSRLKNISIGEALQELSEGQNYRNHKIEPVRRKPISEQVTPSAELKEVAAYDYHDQFGKLVYQVVRYEPKTFKQRAVNEDGSFSWKMDGVERVPYNLVAAMEATMVCIVEGEKDCQTLERLYVTATCNPGGAKKWLPAFAKYFEGKKIILIPDNDQPGQDHAKSVLATLEGKIEWAKWIDLPKFLFGKPIKDITDFVAAHESEEHAAMALATLTKNARIITRGVECEIYSMDELERRYRQEVTVHYDTCLDLSKWLPTLNVRPLVRGDLLGIMAGTGQCKTFCLQNIFATNENLKKLLFELELADSLTTERFISVATGTDGIRVQQAYRSGSSIDWRTGGKIKNVYVCPKSGISMKYVDEQLERAAAKIGEPVDAFAIDYVQLIRGEGKLSRYERISDAAEEAKVLAKKWNCVGIILSQISRKDKNGKSVPQDQVREVNLEDAKESGSIENSCGLVLGIWKTSRTELAMRVLKNTKGLAGQLIEMEIGAGMRINEKANTHVVGK